MKSTTGVKRISVKTCPHFYLKVQFTKENDGQELTPTLYKFTVMTAIKETLGVVGASTQVDVLKTWPNGYAILRIPHSMKEKIWAALTLYGTTKSGVKCSFHVLQTSSYLMALAFDSRNMDGNTESQVVSVH